MKVSLNWLKQYVDVKESKEEVSDILTNIGLEVEGMEIYENITGSLAGLVIGEVLTCQKHPDADKGHPEGPRPTLTAILTGGEEVGGGRVRRAEGRAVTAAEKRQERRCGA